MAEKKKLYRPGRPKGKKKSTRSASTKARGQFNKGEREKWLKIVKEHFGASYVDPILKNAGRKICEWEPALRQLKAKMEQELEDEKRDLDEYYKKIDKEWKTVGRPKSVFNEKELKYLCSIHCTFDEIAGFFQMNKDVLSRKIKQEYGITFTEFYEKNSQGAKVSLRRRQIQAAMDGDTKMLIFLGKNMLGQKEKLDFEGEVKVNSWVDLMNNLDESDEDEDNNSDE